MLQFGAFGEWGFTCGAARCPAWRPSGHLAQRGKWRGAPPPPLCRLVVNGVDRGQRAPQFFLVTAALNGAGGWRLPWPLPSRDDEKPR